MDSIKIIDKNSKDLMIVFSARKTEKGSFTFYKQTIDFPANIIYINDYDTHWYLKGTPDFDNVFDFLNFLKNQINKLKKKNGKLYMLGSSMGAYAALLYGSIFNADKILSFAPEAELCIPLGRSIESLNTIYNEGEYNITNLHYKSPKNVTIIIGNNDIPDLYSASYFYEKNQKLNVKIINNYTHVVAKYIHEKIELKQFILKFFSNKTKNIFNNFELANIISLEDTKALKSFNESLFLDKKIDLQHKKQIIKIANDNPKWSMPQYFAALIFEYDGDIEYSILYLQNALSVQPNLNRARFKLTQLYLKLNLFEKALEECLVLKKHNFTKSVGLLLCNIYLKINHTEAVQETLKQIKLKFGLSKSEEEKFIKQYDV